MEKQSLFKNKKVRAFIIISVAVIASVTGFLIYKKLHPPVVVEPATETVVRQDLTKSITINGTVDSVDTVSYSSTLLDVKITEIAVKVGDRVRTGDVIARLDTTDVAKSLEIANENYSTSNEKSAAERENTRRKIDDANENADIAMKRGQKEIDDAKRGIADAKKELQKAIELRDEREDRLEELDERYYEARIDRKYASSDVDGAKAKVDAAKIRLRDAGREYDKVYERISRYTDALEVSHNKKVREALEEKTDATESLEDAQSNLEKAESALAEYKTKEQEAKGKYEAAKEALKSARADIKTKREALRTARGTLDKAKNSEEDEIRSIGQTIADLEDTDRQSDIGSRTTDLETLREIDKFEKQLEDGVVVARFDGIVTAVPLKVGDRYTGGEIATVKSEEGLMIKSTVDQYDISDIATGMKALIKTETTGDDEMKGKITFVSPVPEAAAGISGSNSQSTQSVSQSTGYPIEISIKNPSDRLRFGMNAKVTIIEKKRKDVLCVPDSVVREREDGSFFVVAYKPLETPGEYDEKEIDVTYGLRTDYYVEIRGEGISEGMKLLLPSDSEPMPEE